MNIDNFLKENEKKELLRFSTAGSVDDGKSTLIGRLLNDSKSIYDDHLNAIKSMQGSSGGEVDWALLTDGLKAEREQGITIDVAYRYFSTPKRKFIIADTPGHEQYTRNMVTGASTADLAIILIDARKGVLTQSKRHTFISALLQIPHLVVAVNKMDLVDYSQEVFEQIRDDFSQFAAKLDIHDLRFLPISALNGDNVVNPSENMPWHTGEPLLTLLETIHIASDRNMVDMRFPVQYVTRPDQNFRGFAGQVASGIIRKGDAITVLPSRKMTKVASLVTYEGEVEEAFPPMSLTVTLEDEVDVSRGDMIVHRHNHPRVGRHFEAMLVWMDEEPMDPKGSYRIKHTTEASKAIIEQINYRVDVNTLEKSEASELRLNEIGRVVFTTYKPLKYDLYDKNRATGCFILIDEISNLTVAAGMIIEREPVDQLPSSMFKPESRVLSERGPKVGVTAEERVQMLNQKPVTLWLTGLVSSGKSSVSYALERRLFEMGVLSKVLDGGTMRRALSRELDFNTHDIAENLRRAAEAAHILNQAGVIAICSFVSPLVKLRGQAREIIGPDQFHEVHLDVSVEWAESHDETGLYKKARAGEVSNLAGVNAPYESPSQPEVHLPMDELSVEQAVDLVIKHLRAQDIIEVS